MLGVNGLHEHEDGGHARSARPRGEKSDIGRGTERDSHEGAGRPCKSQSAPALRGAGARSSKKKCCANEIS